MVSVNTSTSGAIRTKLLKDWPISRDCMLRANYLEATPVQLTRDGAPLR